MVTSVIVISGFTVLVGEREMHAWSNVSFKVYLTKKSKTWHAVKEHCV